jgi:hypothetical protein
MSPTHRSLSVTGTAALLAAVLLAGCGGQDAPTPQDPTSTGTAPAGTGDDGATATGTAAPDDDEATGTAGPDQDGQTATAGPDTDQQTAPPLTLASVDETFTLELPAGWEDALELLEEDQQVLLAAKDQERVDEFYTNVVVTSEEYVSNLTSAVEETAQELAGEDGEYELLDAVPVDGNRAPGYTLVRDVQGTTVHQTQRWISHQGILHVVTFSAVESQAAAVAPLLDQMLDSWRWTD